MKKALTTFSFVLLALTFSNAQKNEVGFTFGGNFTSDQTFSTILPLGLPCTVTDPQCNVISGRNSSSPAFAAGGTFARRLLGVGPASLWLELPAYGVPSHDVTTSVTSPLVPPIAGFSSSDLFFLTPSAKLSFLGSARISPWVSVGGGLAHLSLGNNSRNTGALQYGGGLDFKTVLPHLGLRAEVRDFWSGGAIQGGIVQPLLTTTTISAHQHHIFAGGGVVFKF